MSYIFRICNCGAGEGCRRSHPVEMEFIKFSQNFIKSFLTASLQNASITSCRDEIEVKKKEISFKNEKGYGDEVPVFLFCVCKTKTSAKYKNIKNY